jgi:AcrR family transcriptional regulator
MAAPKTQKQPDQSTEEKIKSAARIVFLQKGYAATRTRDIAEAAGINLALLNYYFRSKEKLFDLIMLEMMQRFVGSLKGLLNDEQTTLMQKVEKLVAGYIDLLSQNPDLPIFILSELRSKPTDLLQKMGAKEVLGQSYFIRQLQEAIQTQQIEPIHPIAHEFNGDDRISICCSTLAPKPCRHEHQRICSID